MSDVTVNHGVLLASPKSTDWIAGSNSDIVYEVRNETGDWTPYLVIKERQKFGTFDSMACVSFTDANLCEIQIKHQTGEEVNFSDRFLAKMSGTTPQGNYISIVADTLRKVGLVREEEWPTPPDPTWETYYSDIPQFVIDRAKPQFLDKYTIQTEWVDVTAEAIEKHLKQAPLQIIIPGHSVTGIILKVSDNKVTYLDTYPGSTDFIKTTRISNIQNVFKVLLTAKQMSNIEFVKVKGTSQYGFLEKTAFTEILHKCINETDAQFMSIKFNIPANYMTAREVVL